MKSRYLLVSSSPNTRIQKEEEEKKSTNLYNEVWRLILAAVIKWLLIKAQFDVCLQVSSCNVKYKLVMKLHEKNKGYVTKGAEKRLMNQSENMPAQSN